tara:strand:+ start:8458 stop:8802 length:345 start_codon:yes stop_codon:yes gene_type:complete
VRCPSCGWSNTLKNYPRKIKQLEGLMNPLIVENLSKLFLNSLDDLTSYTLLKACEELEDKVLEHCINIWERRRLNEKGFDVYYFIGILRNENKKFENKITLEKNKLEQLPPSID